MQVPLFESNRQFGAQVNPIQFQSTEAQRDFGPDYQRAQDKQRINQALVSTGFQLLENTMVAISEIQTLRGKRKIVTGEGAISKERQEELQNFVAGAISSELDDNGFSSIDAASFAENINSLAELDVVLASSNPYYHSQIIEAARENILTNNIQEVGVLGRGAVRDWFENEAMPEYEGRAAVNAATRAAELDNKLTAEEFSSNIENGNLRGALDVVTAALRTGTYSPQEAELAMLQAKELAPLAANMNQFQGILADDNPENAMAFIDQLREKQTTDQPSIQDILNDKQNYDPSRMTPAQFQQFEEQAMNAYNDHVRRRSFEVQTEINEASIQLEREFTETPFAINESRIMAAGFLDHNAVYAQDDGRRTHQYFMNRLAQLRDGPQEVQLSGREQDQIDRLIQMRREGAPPDTISKEWMDYYNQYSGTTSAELADQWWPEFWKSVSNSDYERYSDSAYGTDLFDTSEAIENTFDSMLEDTDDPEEIRELNARKHSLVDNLDREIQSIITGPGSMVEKQEQITQVRQNAVNAMLSDDFLKTTSFMGEQAATRMIFSGRREAIDALRQVDNGQLRGLINDVAGVDTDTFRTVNQLQQYQVAKLEQDMPGLDYGEPMFRNDGGTSFFVKVMEPTSAGTRTVVQWASDQVRRESDLLRGPRQGALQQLDPESQEQFIELTYRVHPSSGEPALAVFNREQDRWVFIRDDAGLRASFGMSQTDVRSREETRQIERNTRTNPVPRRN